MAKKTTPKRTPKRTGKPAKPVFPQGRPPRAGQSSRVRIPFMLTQSESDRLDRLAQIVAPVHNDLHEYNRSEAIRMAIHFLADHHGVSQ